MSTEEMTQMPDSLDTPDWWAWQMVRLQAEKAVREDVPLTAVYMS